jgi:FAD/FMN-containing dehydrogenase
MPARRTSLGGRPTRSKTASGVAHTRLTPRNPNPGSTAGTSPAVRLLVLHHGGVSQQTDGAVLPDQTLNSLRDAVGPSHVLTDRDLRATYETDWTRRFHGEAAAVVRPATVDEVVAVLRACGEVGAAVVPQGGNTGLVGGGVPRVSAPRHERGSPRPQIVLSTLRLRDLEAVDEVAGEVTVGAGVALAALQEHVRGAGWDFGVDMGSRDSATVGGMVAANAGGVNVLRYGVMRQQVVGIEAVLADGSIIRRLQGLVKDNTGYALPSLLAGSEGTLAVVSRVRLRLVPQLPRRAVALLAVDDAAQAAAFAAQLRRSLATLTAAEVFDDDGMRLVLQHRGGEPPFREAHPRYLLIECGAATDPTDDLVDAIARLPSRDAVAASDEGGRHRLWKLREGHTEAVNAAGVPHKIDVAVPISRIGEFDVAVREAIRRADPGARTFVYGHVGDGNLHVNILGPAPDDETVDDAVLELAIEFGGTVSAEHGIGVAKVRWLVADRGDPDVAAMRAIKRSLDPADVLNPGVLFATPLAPG